MAELNAWDIVAANNNSTPPDGWPENTMQYSEVNDTAREGMAVMARWYKDNNGSLQLAGVADAYTLTLNAAHVSYFAGMTFKAEVNITNTGATTINVNAIGVANVVNQASAALGAGDLQAGGIYEFIYDGTNFQMLGDVAAGSGVFDSLTVNGNSDLNGTLDISGDITDTGGTLTLSGAGSGIFANSNLYVRDGVNFRVYDATNVDYVEITHDGTDGLITSNNGNLHLYAALGTISVGSPGGTAEQMWFESGSTASFYNAGNTSSATLAYDGTALNITGLANSWLDLHGGMGLRIYDAIGGDLASFEHDGLALNTRFTQTTNWDIYLDDLTGALRLYDITGAVNPVFTFDTFRSTRYLPDRHYDVGRTDYIETSHDGTNYKFDGINTTNIYFDNSDVGVLGGQSLKLYDSTDTDNISFSHDGVDFNLVGTNTTDWNISGLTAIQAGTVDADFDAITATSYGGITEANLVDLSATETITGTWTLDGVVTTADYGTGGRVKDGTDVSRPIGFNVIPVYEIDANDAFDLAHNGMMWHRDTTTTIAYTCNNDGNIPVGATFMVSNENGTGTLTVAQGTATLRWFAGSGTPSTGTRTIAHGGVVTVYKYADAEFWIWGIGIS